MFRTASILIGVLMKAGAAAQGWQSGPAIYPEKLRDDVEALRALVHAAHPDPYRYATKAELDRLFDAVRDSIEAPASSSEFQSMLLPLLHRIGDAGLRVLPDASTEHRMRSIARFLPLRFRIIDSSLYVAEELMGFSAIPVGSRLIAIEREPCDELLEELGRLIVTDGANTSRRRFEVERSFAELYLRARGERESFRVEYEMPEGSRGETMIKSLTRIEMDAMRRPDTGRLPWHSEWEADAEVLWVTLSTLDEQVLVESGQDDAAFISGMLKDLRQNGAHALVLDLRGAGGSELGMAESIFSALAMAPYRLVQGMTVCWMQPQQVPSICSVDEDHFSAIARNYLPDGDRCASLRADDERLALSQPQARRFDGPVYVVCDGGTRDAAAMLATLARRSGRAEIVGEELGTNAHSFTGGRALQCVLPASGLRISVPLVRYIPDGDAPGAPDRGEPPHHSATEQAWGIAKGRDTVRAALIELIKALR